MVINYDDINDVYMHVLKARNKALRAINSYLDLKIAYIQKAKEEGIYNPQLMQKLKEVSVEV